METTRSEDIVDEFDLAKLDDAYESATGDDEFESVPDGNYSVRVERAELKRSRTSNRKMLEWELVVTSGEHEGRKLWKYTLLETPENVAWAKKDFRRIDFQLAKLSDLPSRLEGLLDLRIEITKKTKGEFEGIYFRRRLAQDETNGDRPF